MPSIHFFVDGTEYTITKNTRDPYELYRSANEIKERLRKEGWRFESTREKPDYQELANLARETDGTDISLGDITDRVEPISQPTEVTVTVVGPDGSEREFNLRTAQNLGALAGKVSDAWELELTERPEFYWDEEKAEKILNDVMASEVDAKQIFFDLMG